MKKYTVLFNLGTDENPNFAIRPVFAETSADIKKLDGFLTVKSSERVNHPTPEVMQRVILAYEMEANTPSAEGEDTPAPITLAAFYERCDVVAKAMAEEAAKRDAEMSDEERAKLAEAAAKREEKRLAREAKMTPAEKKAREAARKHLEDLKKARQKAKEAREAAKA